MPNEADRTVLHVLPHPGGGGETYVDLLEEMSGYRFERLYLGSGPNARRPEVARGVAAAVRASRRHDLLHVHGEVAAGLCLPLLAARPSVVTLHGMHLVRRARGVAGAAARVNLRAILRAADRTICVSASEHDELVRAVGAAAAHRAVVVRNGVRVPDAVSEEERAAIRESLGIAPSEIVAIWVGSLDNRKDPLTAARAAEEATVTILVVGDGPLRKEVDRLASEHVRVLGQRSDVDRLLAASDVFLLTSRREGLSFSLLEAMAHGLVPVVTDLPENLEAVGDAGIVVSLDEADALSSALGRLVADESEQTHRGERALRRVAHSFTDDETRRRTRDLYDHVLRAV